MSQNQVKKTTAALLNDICKAKARNICTGVGNAHSAYMIARCYKERPAPLMLLAATTEVAQRFMEDLTFFIGSTTAPIFFFPPYNILPFKFIAYHNDTAAKRIEILYRLITHERPPLIVTTIAALLQKIVPKKTLTEYAELVMEGEEIAYDRLAAKLVAGGYTHTTLVEEPGDFCARGGILDVYSPLHADPIRIELFGDMVESIRFFSATTQRKLNNISEAIILPAKEVVLDSDQLDQIVGRIRRRAARMELPVSQVRVLIERIKKEGIFPGAESLIALMYPQLSTLFDYLPEDTHFFLSEPDELDEAAQKLMQQADENYRLACRENKLCVEPVNLYLPWTEAQNRLQSKSTTAFKMLPVISSRESGAPGAPSSHYQFEFEDNTELTGAIRQRHDKGNLLAPLAQWIADKKNSGFVTIITVRTSTQADRLNSLLAPYDIQLPVISQFPDEHRNSGLVYLCIGRMSAGFVWPEQGLAVLTEDEIFGPKRHRKKRAASKIKTGLIAFEDMSQGDLVVHKDHGIGRYDGLTKLQLNGKTNDFLLITYKDDDKLYLPADRMGMIQKYMGVDGIEPVLDRMGGKSWQRVREKVKRSAEKIAGELLNIYAAREVVRGYRFSGLDTYFSDFEASFQFEETADQLKAIDDVLADMQTDKPMDRLVCGDVGYGKTEVALRASFLAVNDGKQAALLVPTTVLAEQHYTTFKDRFANYPINIACLSRFRSRANQKNILAQLAEGRIDIIIGTHRLLQKDVVFKDLGLLVLDEEQRFGVKHKERLKKYRNSVDVLALTATPIPRTLHMSLMGIRDISVISTPPELRQPIITYLSEFDDAVVAEAIRAELGRKGQIYFIHNNINSIESMAAHIRRLVPEVRLDIAHGRLDEKTLEKVMMRFMRKELDLLLCTTIIESGIDVPTANTILINRADRFGLAQIYQLRGRVGRSDEQAYAYLFIPKDSALGKDAQKRLKVLMEHSDLGSGFQIAMSDLRIRGGGTILGASQSGHIAAVGYEMFLDLMENAMADLKGKAVQPPLEPEINVPMSDYLPESYIADIDQRLGAYRRLTRMTRLKEIADYKAELVDRFGLLPKEASNLLLKIMLRVLAIQSGIKRIDLQDGWVSLHFSPEHLDDRDALVKWIFAHNERFSFTPDHILRTRLPAGGLRRHLTETKNLLKEITQHVNG